MTKKYQSLLNSSLLVVSIFLIFPLTQCLKKTAQHQDSDTLGIKVDATTGTALIDWSCAGKGRTQGQGFLTQEEYCEWDRNTKNSSSGKLSCVFRTAFDQTRKNFLTQDKGNGNFSDRQFNSYAFLVGGTEPDSGIFRRGIVGHCIEGFRCGEGDKENPGFAGNCVPSRASDPQICQALNSLGAKGCKVKPGELPIFTAGQVPSGRHGDKPVKLQLSAGPGVSSNCKYIVDPNFSASRAKPDPQNERTLLSCEFNGNHNFSDCDAVAENIIVTSKVIIDNPQCVGGAATNPGNTTMAAGQFCKLKSSPAGGEINIRDKADGTVIAKVPDGFSPVKLRGFIGNFVSVELKLPGTGGELGAQVNKPAFIHKTQFDVSSCK